MTVSCLAVTKLLSLTIEFQLTTFESKSRFFGTLLECMRELRTGLRSSSSLDCYRLPLFDVKVNAPEINAIMKDRRDTTLTVTDSIFHAL